MVIIRCPTGCGPLRRPYALRATAVRCANCTAWFAAGADAEDGSLVDGRLLARPGETLASPRPRQVVPWGWVVAAACAAVAVALAAGAGLW